MYKKYSLIGLICVFANIIFAQHYTSPLNFEMLLSGTFGELRPNHFHSGIDIITQGVAGKNVYAVADGYVSRIKISAWGYGKAIYISHPDGKTSVYGHLSRFNEKINSYVEIKQYEKESFEIELFPDPQMFPIQQGELIALSGNTGGSSGPHLHFEIRDTKTEHPLNPLKYGFNIIDNIAPIIENIKIYPIEGKIENMNQEKNYSVKKAGNQYIFEKKLPKVSGKIAFGISTYDLLNNSANKNGIYTIKLFVDDMLIYHFQMDEFDFGESRYINAHIDYKEKKNTGKYFHKCYVLPNNLLSIYPNTINNGIVHFKDNLTHTIRFLVTDTYGNNSELKFDVQSTTPSETKPIINTTNIAKKFSYLQENQFSTNRFSLHMKANSLYEDIDFEYTEKSSIQGIYGNIHQVHHNDVPVHQYYTISINEKIPTHLKQKVFIAKLSEKNHFEYVGNTWNEEKLTASVREFGSFCIVADTINPIIKGINISAEKNCLNQVNIQCSIKDLESGIEQFRGEIDGKWILMEYEYKNNTLTYVFPQNFPIGNHLFKLIVTDKTHNSTTYTCNFKR